MNFPPVVRLQSVNDLPNISVLLGEELTRVGIRTPDELRNATAFGAWEQLHRAGYVHETHVLLALEGAIEGVSWQTLPPLRKHTLLHLARSIIDSGQPSPRRVSTTAPQSV